MVGSHKERIEMLETKIEALDVGFSKIDRMERIMERILRKKGKKSASDSSSVGSDDSGESSDDIRLVRDEEDERRPRKGEDRWKNRPKLTCPTFNGTDPSSWLSRVQQYFDLNEVGKADKVRYAAFFLEGEANVWWQWANRVYRKKGKTIRWKDFEKEIMNWFGPSEYTDHDEALSRIKQSGSLREYQKKFEQLANRVHDWP